MTHSVALVQAARRDRRQDLIQVRDEPAALRQNFQELFQYLVRTR